MSSVNDTESNVIFESVRVLKTVLIVFGIQPSATVFLRRLNSNAHEGILFDFVDFPDKGTSVNNIILISMVDTVVLGSP